MAVFNGGDFLEESIRSIAGQTFRDWELVVVDDASTDATRDVVASWSRRDPRIRLVANDRNKGQTACLNQGLHEGRGEWVARQDADDVSDPRRLAAQMDYLVAHPDTALLGTQGVLVDTRGKRTGLLDVPCDHEGIAWCAPFLNPFLHTSVIFRRSVVAELGGYDESFRIAQDYDLWTRLAAHDQTANLPERLVSYRHVETSLSKSGRNTAFAEADRVSAREAKRFLGRDWTEREARVAGAFRRGLEPSKRKEFWELIAECERELGKLLPPRIRASWHLRIAGSTNAFVEVLAAAHADPAFTARWIAERLFGTHLLRPHPKA